MIANGGGAIAANCFSYLIITIAIIEKFKYCFLVVR
ncbi:hypothetical protein N752_08285 [Desulforamulus aquiferis]|nr:hypothetical protein N752_08285 [Desulforamulus aquiferis]